MTDKIERYELIRRRSHVDKCLSFEWPYESARVLEDLLCSIFAYRAYLVHQSIDPFRASCDADSRRTVESPFAVHPRRRRSGSDFPFSVRRSVGNEQVWQFQRNAASLAVSRNRRTSELISALVREQQVSEMRALNFRLGSLGRHGSRAFDNRKSNYANFDVFCSGWSLCTAWLFLAGTSTRNQCGGHSGSSESAQVLHTWHVRNDTFVLRCPVRRIADLGSHLERKDTETESASIWVLRYACLSF